MQTAGGNPWAFHFILTGTITTSILLIRALRYREAKSLAQASLGNCSGNEQSKESDQEEPDSPVGALSKAPWVLDQAAQAKRAAGPALRGIWAPPASALPLVFGLSNPTVFM